MPDDTAEVQAAIDAIALAGGGRVVLSGGRTYVCGSIELRSHVELHLEPGSRLVAAPRIDDYARRFTVGALASGVSAASSDATAALIWAEGAVDVAITGAGVIDGSADAYVLEHGEQIHRMTNARPFPVFLVGCTGVRLRDVRFVNSALWTVRLSGCRNVNVSGVRIDNDMRIPNADGIDLDHCQRVQVVGCDIRTPDDGISLKTTDEFASYGACEDVVVSACTITSRSTAITLGVDAEQPIRNVVVSACVIRDSHRGVSVSVGSGAGGTVEDVVFTDLVIESRHDDDAWWGCGEPIVIRSAPWHTSAGAVRRVRVRNVLARAENGILVYAGGDGAVEDLELTDVRLDLGRWTSWPGRRLDLRPFDAAPTEGPYAPALLPCEPAAVRIEGAHGVRLRGLDLHRSQPVAAEYGPALVVDRARHVRWDEFDIDRDASGQLVLDGEAVPLSVSGLVP